jgi:uncharacterized membrane protein YkvI
VLHVKSAKKTKLHVFARKRNIKNVIGAYIEALYMHTVMLTDLVLEWERLHFQFKRDLHDLVEWLSQWLTNTKEFAALNIEFSNLLLQ